MRNNKNWFWGVLVFALLGMAGAAFGGESELVLPDLGGKNVFPALGGMTGTTLMYIGILVCAIGGIFGLVQYIQTRDLPVHDSMRNVSNVIWETCKSYLVQQGKFLGILWVLIGVCIVYYFAALQHMDLGRVVLILCASILGI